jgi:hypothetical protein
MNTKCNNCGAPQAYTENSICNYCGAILESNEIEKNYVDDFFAIQYEYKNRRYKKVISLADKYLKTDKHNIPCWSIKILSEFLVIEEDEDPDLNGLINSIESLIELKITNQDSLKSMEIQLKDGIERSIAESYSWNRDYPNLERLVSFSEENFSISFVDWLKTTRKSLENIYNYFDDVQEGGLPSLFYNKFDFPAFCEAARFSVQNKTVSVPLLKDKLNYDIGKCCILMRSLEFHEFIITDNNGRITVVAETAEDLEEMLTDLSNHISYVNSKKSQSESKKKDKGCFIATAAMGDYNHPVVVDLRNFRDEWLLQRNWGISFTNWYYTHGPKAASIIEQSKFLRKLTFCVVIKPLQVITKLMR